MAAKDTYHNAVRNGLEKEGWTITHDPLKIDFGDVAIWAWGMGHWHGASEKMLACGRRLLQDI